MKQLLAMGFFALLILPFTAQAFPQFHNNPSNKYICVYQKHSKWHLEIDFATGVIYSFEAYRDKQTLEYQTYSRMEDDHVYEFKSVDFTPKNREAYLAYFNPQKLKVTIIRVNTKPGEEITSYQFDCSVEESHLLLIE